ncbi:MAG: HNH endonuclease [Thiotrichaceae bacterium]|nr:MAG: HNH endonuclease [Thiotrichaceae bacterium]
MNYWWVNQRQTHRHEIGEGYMWSPKRQQNGNKHFSYEYMKHIQPRDIIFSYANSAIVAVGIAKTHCYSFPKPLEFGRAGIYWSNEGWKVDVHYHELVVPIRTIDYIDSLKSLLPTNKSPIRRENGWGNQAYLFQIGEPLALALAHLIDEQTVTLVSGNYVADISKSVDTIDLHIEDWENRIEESIRTSPDFSVTEKDTLVKARRGQGKYRELLLRREHRCRITGVDKSEHLIASHIKPWRSSNNDERLDPENGFMLTPTIDHLFDKGFISFENDGGILLADVADRDAMERMGVIGEDVPTNVGHLRDGQKQYLDWHRTSILLK